jgi:hypothetical protein
MSSNHSYGYENPKKMFELIVSLRWAVRRWQPFPLLTVLHTGKLSPLLFMSFPCLSIMISAWQVFRQKTTIASKPWYSDIVLETPHFLMRLNIDFKHSGIFFYFLEIYDVCSVIIIFFFSIIMRFC